ncbi:glycosyltransferase family 4 protein [Niveispirillum fermenti]|uniref:glycosyltransferase family 4 protein n=1 Tax=Niveispirillum fermenti TaxID=1233113 RepID=UPI003A83D0F0
MPANTAILFHPEAFDTNSPTLMGRHAAGEGFLKAWARHAGHERLYCYIQQAPHADAFLQVAASAGWRGQVEGIGWDNPAALAGPGGLFIPGPGLDRQAWFRHSHGLSHAYSLVGITHTTASAMALDDIGSLLTGPVEEWDAVICTSEAVRSMVERTLTDQLNHLRQRLGVTGTPSAPRLPQLPVIPLGVDCDQFTPRPAARQAWRERLGIAAADVAVLFMGRLSFHAKAHPVAMYKAMQAALPSLPAGARLHLIEAGWFGNDAIREAFDAAATLHCPNIVRHVVDGRQADARQEIWHAADIFCSLSDNIQETFGLTPVEAMAAGLACVVSDWNGYKETVRDGIDGMRIPTWMPQAGMGADFALYHAMGFLEYDLYCGAACQFVAVDIARATDAFRALIADPALRRRMGEAGRAHARARFDWRVVIPAYQTLLSGLEARRTAARQARGEGPRRAGTWPLRADPFHAFAHYSTHHPDADVRVALAPDSTTADLDGLLSGAMVRYAAPLLPKRADMAHVIATLSAAGGMMTVAGLLNTVPAGRKGFFLRSLPFMAKHGLLLLAPPDGPRGPA